MNNYEKKIATKISIKGMVVNLFLFAIKGICGLLINSVSLMSDAVHSLTDIFSTLIVLIGLKISYKPEDKKHPYGHERIECIIAFLLGIMLFVIGFIIGYEGICKIYCPSNFTPELSLINICAISSAIISILAKEWMYRFTIKCAKKINSSSMSADAWHHRTDAISSIGSLVGVVGICFGVPLIDVIACFAISLFIFKAAFDICCDACKRMIDTSADDCVIEQIQKEILTNDSVISIDLLKTRQFGSKLYADIEITLDKNISFEQAHAISHTIHDDIEQKFPQIKHCMIHFNPST